MLNIYHLHLPKNGEIAGQILNSFQNLLLKIKYWFGQIGYIISLILFSPILIGFWCVLKAANYFFSKSVNNLKNSLSKDRVENLLNVYIEIRTAYNKADLRLAKVKDITNSFLKESDDNFLFQLFSSEIEQYLSLGQKYLTLIDNALARIDENAPKGAMFQLTTESELWQNRNKMYQYRI